MKSARFALSVIVAAALIAPASPTFAGNTAKRSASSEKIDICHVAKNGSARLISVSANAALAHARHGDNVPGDSVAGLTNFVYDDTCTPVETGPAAGCYYSALFFDLKVKGDVGGLNNAAFSVTRDGTCSGTEGKIMTIVHGTDIADARKACAAVGAPDTSVISATVFKYDSLPTTTWFC